MSAMSNQSSQSKYQSSELVKLVASAQKGDNIAFERLYNHYFSPLHSYITLRVGSSDDADDLTQQVFLKFHKNLANWQNQGYQPSAYLYSIARSVIADHFRAKSRRGTSVENSEELFNMLSDESQNPHQDVLVAEENQQLLHALYKLPNHFQEVLLLRYMENLSSQQISELIKKSDVATRKILSRATKALANQLELDKEESKS